MNHDLKAGFPIATEFLNCYFQELNFIKDISGFVLITSHSFLITCNLLVKLPALVQSAHVEPFPLHTDLGVQGEQLQGISENSGPTA